MDRRKFIKFVAATAVAALIPIHEATCCPTVLTNREKELFIAKALSTPEGEAALAKAMIEPIRDQVEYDETGIPCCGHDYSTMTREELVAKWGPETDHKTRKEQINKLIRKRGYEEI